MANVFEKLTILYLKNHSIQLNIKLISIASNPREWEPQKCCSFGEQNLEVQAVNLKGKS